MTDNIVYVVTSGDYSDYCIGAVFTSKTMAENYIEAHSDEYTYYRIEEYKLDFVDDLMIKASQGLFAYQIDMDFGGNSEVERTDNSDFKHYINLENYVVISPNILINTKSRKLEIIVFAKDKQHAVKIANEKRVQLIADGTLTFAYQEE